jgi:hypothetical protein
MDDLIEALQIFQKYTDSTERNPTWCGHDVFAVCHQEDVEISDEDKKRLEELSFTWDDELEGFSSYRFGSC